MRQGASRAAREEGVWVHEKKDENENEAEDEGPRTNRRGEVLMSSVEMGRREGRQSKRVKGAEVAWHCLIPLLQTPPPPPPPLQFPRLFRNEPASAIHVSTTRLFRKHVWPKLLRQFGQSAKIAVLTVSWQQAHHKLSFGIIFSPHLSTSSSGRPIQTMPFRQSEPFRQCYSDTPDFFCMTPK